MDQHEGTSADAVTASSDAIAGDAREKRIADLLSESLAKSNPLEATIGATNAELMLIGKRFGQVVGEALNQPPENLAELDELMPSVNGYLRITKQIERFSTLQRKFKTDK
jgi:hypothetical protein